jgi:epsilon-lactone hydrolase
MLKRLARRQVLQAASGAMLAASATRPVRADPVSSATSPMRSYISDQGAIEIRPFSLPPSRFLNRESRDLFVQQARLWEAWKFEGAELARRGAAPAEIRAAYARMLEPTLQKQLRRFPTRIEEATVAGVRTHRVRPLSGAQPSLVLIGLHGGGMSVGDGVSALIEAIPIAATARVEVISVDYRMAPEYKHPAARDDVVAVYAALLKDYPASAIGMFGSSAGALLAAQATSHLVAENMPPPGALAMLALGAGPAVGDSFNLIAAVDRLSGAEGTEPAYLSGADPTDQTLYPVDFPSRLARFPPSLLAASTRDIGLSSVANTHAGLVAAGVPAELHIWEGLRHCFYYDPEFRESAQVYNAVARFFRARLRPRQ